MSQPGQQDPLTGPAPVAGLATVTFTYRDGDGDAFACRFPVLTSQAVTALAETMGESRHRLQRLSVAERCRELAAVLDPWQQPAHPVRRLAQKWLPVMTGYSPEVIRAGFDDLMQRLTGDALAAMVETALAGRRAGERGLPFGPPWTLHIAAGNVPGVGLFSTIVSLLAGSPAAVKVAGAQPLLPLLLHHQLHAQRSRLAEAVWPLYWPRQALHGPVQALIAAAPALLVYGADETVTTYRGLAGPQAQFIAHGHRFSLAVLGSEGLKAQAGAGLEDLLHGLARDVALYDQQGCLSPHVLYVLGDEGRARQVAARLHRAMETVAQQLPPGQVPAAAAARLRQLVETRRFLDDDTGVWGRPGRQLVIYQGEPGLQLSPLYRTVWLRPVAGLEEMVAELGTALRRVATIGAAGLAAAQLEKLRALVGPHGVPRITTFGRMQRPPATWHHDGRLDLDRLFHWCQLEL